MDFFALAAAFAQPPDHAVAHILTVGHDAKQFVNPLLAKRLRRKRQLRLVAQLQLAQRFADRQKAVIGPSADEDVYAVSCELGKSIVLDRSCQTLSDLLGKGIQCGRARRRLGPAKPVPGWDNRHWGRRDTMEEESPLSNSRLPDQRGKRASALDRQGEDKRNIFEVLRYARRWPICSHRIRLLGYVEAILASH